jgi:hypothetical protein
MSLHHGFRALWPVIFFLPWLLLGSAYLGGWALRRLSSPARLPSIGTRSAVAFPAGGLRIVGVGLLVGLGLLLITASVALADPVPEAHAPCPVTAQEEARRLGDNLFEQGAYQRAGECYQAAGEFGLANRAFVKAVGPQSAVTASQLSEQREQAKTMLRKVQLAFQSKH